MCVACQRLPDLRQAVGTVLSEENFMWLFNRFYIRRVHMYSAVVVVAVAAVVGVMWVALGSGGDEVVGPGSPVTANTPADGDRTEDTVPDSSSAPTSFVPADPDTTAPVTIKPGGSTLPPFAIVPTVGQLRATLADTARTQSCRDAAQRMLNAAANLPTGVPVPLDSPYGKLVTDFQSVCR